MQQLITVILFCSLINSCSSVTERKVASSPKSKEQTSVANDRVIKFPSGRVNIDRLESILFEKLNRSVVILDIEKYRNPLAYTSALLYGDHVGFEVSLQVDNEFDFKCRIYEHNPGSKKVVNLSCKGNDKEIAEVFKDDAYFLHIDLNLVLEKD